MAQYETELCYCGETSVNKITSLNVIYICCAAKDQRSSWLWNSYWNVFLLLFSDLGSEAVQRSLRIKNKIFIPKVVAFFTASSLLQQMAVVHL